MARKTEIFSDGLSPHKARSEEDEKEQYSSDDSSKSTTR